MLDLRVLRVIAPGWPDSASARTGLIYGEEDLPGMDSLRTSATNDARTDPLHICLLKIIKYYDWPHTPGPLSTLEASL